MTGQYEDPKGLERQGWVSSKLVGAEVIGYAGNYGHGMKLSIQIKTATGEIFWLRNGRVEFHD